MTIASEISKVAYSGNGSTVRFAIPFPFLRRADLRVLLRGTGGEETDLTLSTHYGLEEQDVGGTCIMHTAPAVGETLVIKRDPAIVQETVYEEGVPLSAKSREDALDLVTMICQANRERVDRAVKLSPASQSGKVTMPAPQGGRVIAWNAKGDDLENGPVVVDIQTSHESALAAQAASERAEIASDQARAANAAAQTARNEAQALAGAEASAIQYSNTTSGLASGNVQEALDELAYDTETLSGLGRQMSLGMFQLMESQSMSSMDCANRVLHTFEDGSGIDGAGSSGYQHDASGNLVRVQGFNSLEVVAFDDPDDFVQEDVKESITSFVVDTANTSGHFSDGSTVQTVKSNSSLVSVSASMVSSAGSFGWYTNVADVFDNDGVNCFYSVAADATITIDFGVGNEQALCKWDRHYYTEHSSTEWQPVGVHRYWRLRCAAAIPNSGATTSTWHIEYSDAGDSWVQVSTFSYHGNSIVADMRVYALIEADALKIVPGTRVVTPSGEVVITEIVNLGDGDNEVHFTGTLSAGTHTVTGIYGTQIADGKVALQRSGSGYAQVPQSAGTAYSNANYDATNPNVAFNGRLIESALGRNSGTLYVGKDWGAGVSRVIQGVKVWGSSGNGYAQGGSAVTISLYGSNTGVHLDGVLLGHVVENLVDVDKSNPQEKFGGFTNTPYRYHWVEVVPANASVVTLLAEVEFYTVGVLTPTNVFYSATTKDINTQAWTDIDSIALTEDADGQTVRYALSFDGGTTYKGWDGDSWEIVSYPCPANGSGWMSGSTLTGLADADLPDPAGSLRVAVAFKTTSATSAPEVDALTFDVTGESTGMVLQLTALPTTGVPSKATVLAVTKGIDAPVLNTDLIAEVSRNGGATWQAVNMSKVADFLADRIVVEGKAEFSHPDGGSNEALMRIRGVAGKDFEVHFMSLGVVV